MKEGEKKKEPLFDKLPTTEPKQPLVVLFSSSSSYFLDIRIIWFDEQMGPNNIGFSEVPSGLENSKVSWN